MSESESGSIRILEQLDIAGAMYLVIQLASILSSSGCKEQIMSVKLRRFTDNFTIIKLVWWWFVWLGGQRVCSFST